MKSHGIRFVGESWMKILIVEDQKEVLIIIEKLIRSMGHETYSANNGAIAYEMLKNDFTFDAIVCDFNMPLMTGLELRLKLNSEFESCPPFILVSGDLSQVKEEEHKKMFYCLLQKPSEVPLIEEKLNEIAKLSML